MLTVDKKDGEFVFGVSANSTFMSENKNGIPLGHAYSVLKAVQFDDEDGKKIRLVKIRYVGALLGPAPLSPLRLLIKDQKSLGRAIV